MLTTSSMGVFAKMEELMDEQDKYKEMDKEVGHHVTEYELNQMKLEKEMAEQEHLIEVRSVYNQYAQE